MRMGNSLDSMYRSLIQSSQPVINNNKNWKMKIPSKTKIFVWYLHRGVILTKDNLAQCNWQVSKKCVFYHHDDTIEHFFSSVSLRDLYGQSSK
jgi:hypothetical protein